MYQHMPPTNPRKRQAPGAAPVPMQQQQQSYNAPNQASQAEYMRWNGQENVYPDSSGYNVNNYNTNGMSQPQFDQSIPAQSTQLARRPMNRAQLVQAAQRPYDGTNDPWAQFGDDALLDPTQANGALMESNDDIELLEEKATAAKRDAQAKRKQIPPFVQKLSSFLDDGKNTELIRWSDRGDSFVVLDEDEFAKTLIPELFKHNNYASFVRQLNMYGFHKRVGLSDNSMKASERKNKSPSEYYNPYFKRGHPNLLWLINKPKGGNTKSKSKNRLVKNEEEAESDDDAKDIEEVYGNNIQPQRAISAVPEAGPLQRRDVAILQNQLAEIQKNQSSITGAINRLRKDHNQLYQQALAFQTLHDRHENSINAILTFLATVYNRSLDGQSVPQNIADMFANGIPNHQQPSHVSEVNDVSNQQQQAPGSMSPHRRQQRLLMAPPTGRAATATPSTDSGTPQPPTYSRRTPQASAIEEIYDSPETIPTNNMPTPAPPSEMMSVINNANAQSRSSNNSIAFPDMLSHYENANGNSPLTSEQRNTMLGLMANTSAAGNTNNALVSPSPPQGPTLQDLAYRSDEIDGLLRLNADQEDRIDNVTQLIKPLSPSGHIPGLEDDYFDPNGTFETGSNLDLDQYLDTGAFHTGSSPLGNGSGNGYDDASWMNGAGANLNGDGGLDSHFDVGMDGTLERDQRDLRSEGATPEMVIEEQSQRSPSKRRRRN